MRLLNSKNIRTVEAVHRGTTIWLRWRGEKNPQDEKD